MPEEDPEVREKFLMEQSVFQTGHHRDFGEPLGSSHYVENFSQTMPATNEPTRVANWMKKREELL